MNVKFVTAAALASLCLCVSTPANQTATLKCADGANQVSFYASLSADKVASQLPCGEQVEVMRRDRGFVKVRTSQGSEGYVLASTLPGKTESRTRSEMIPEAAAGTVEAVNMDPATPADYTTLNAHCATYFSAYGVSPAQLRWITNDARKRYPGICPAPNPGVVDYVVIFTHDADFYPSAMPQPIYRDTRGFSDWTPLTTEDTALVPASRLDHAHHEYVWVFHVARGSFNPDTFSSKTRAQFAKTESRDAQRTASDAFGYIANTASRPPAPSLGQ
ncbi:MAG TPA: SH3 domain-containing protein [Candidatus Acidoferrales bacterium]|nr:SH3 domain-containing protein [Candidatus Acidoferrales bacterium]